MNNRRKLTIALGAGALTAPFSLFAQLQRKVSRIGFLSSFPPNNDLEIGPFKQQLRDLGHVEGKTTTIDYLSAEGNYDRLPTLAADLVRRNVDVIMTVGGTPAATAAKNATRTIPIVFLGAADPVGLGLVASLARPNGNVTGVTNQSQDMAGKILALLKETVPSAKGIAILCNPTNSSHPQMIQDMQAAAKVLHLQTTIVNVGGAAEIEGAFAGIARDRVSSLLILPDGVFRSEAGRITALAARYRLITIGGHNSVPESGGLMSYGANRLDLTRRAAVLVDKILKGAKPAGLPVEQPTRFELVVNMKTAKTLGIKIPPSVMVQATKVIE